jgi:Zinc finger, ZZ type
MNLKAIEGWTPLYQTPKKPRVDINSKDEFRRTPIHLAISCGHFSTVKLPVEHASNPSIIDGYGRSALDWASMNQSMFNLMGKWCSIYIPTSHKIQVQSLHQIICQLSERLLETKQKETSPGFHELGHRLMFLQDFDEAGLSFQEQIVEGNDDGSPVHEVHCDICNESNIVGSRFVCRICPDTDICADCMRQYPQEDTL